MALCPIPKLVRGQPLRHPSGGKLSLKLHVVIVVVNVSPVVVALPTWLSPILPQVALLNSLERAVVKLGVLHRHDVDFPVPCSLLYVSPNLEPLVGIVPAHEQLVIVLGKFPTKKMEILEAV